MDCSVDADANTKYRAHVAHCGFGRMLTATPTHSENEFHASRHILLGEVDDATLKAGRGRSGWKTMPPNAFTPGIFLIIPSSPISRLRKLCSSDELPKENRTVYREERKFGIEWSKSDDRGLDAVLRAEVS